MFKKITEPEEHYVLYFEGTPYKEKYSRSRKVYFNLSTAKSAKTRLKNSLKYVGVPYDLSETEKKEAYKKAEQSLDQEIQIIKYLPQCVIRD